METQLKEQKSEKTIEQNANNCEIPQTNNELNVENNSLDNNKSEETNSKTNGVFSSSDLDLIENLRQENTRIRSMISSLEVIKDKLIVIIDECHCETSMKGRQEIFELIANYNQMKINDYEVANRLPNNRTLGPNIPKRKYKKRKYKLPAMTTTGKKRGRPRKMNQSSNNTNETNNCDESLRDLSLSTIKYLEQEFQEESDFDDNQAKSLRSGMRRRKVGKYISTAKVYKSVTIGDQVFACLRSSDKLFHCEWPDCGKSFGQKGNIIRHYAVHGAEKEYKCDWPNCTREFADSSTLKRHLLVHSGKKPFECDWPSCGYKCNSHSGLKVHKRRHTGEKPYKCDWPGCCAAFTSASNLIEHRRTHTGEKPYKCDWPGCSFESSGSSDLKKHRRIHTGEKPYRCEWPGCTSRTGTSSEMKQHRRTHTGERPYKCDFPGCEFNASHATVIRKHKRSRHKI